MLLENKLAWFASQPHMAKPVINAQLDDIARLLHLWTKPEINTAHTKKGLECM